MKTITYTSKKLQSGNLQVKFYIEENQKSRYGYLLAPSGSTSEDIMEEIQQRIAFRETSKHDLLRFSFKEGWKDDYNFFLYTA
nr:hypothetical protein [Cytophagales bacterium]